LSSFHTQRNIPNAVRARIGTRGIRRPAPQINLLFFESPHKLAILIAQQWSYSLDGDVTLSSEDTESSVDFLTLTHVANAPAIPLFSQIAFCKRFFLISATGLHWSGRSSRRTHNQSEWIHICLYVSWVGIQIGRWSSRFGGNQMKRILSAVCCIAVGSIPALAQSKAAGGAAMTDQQFVDFAAQTDMVEANLGQLSQTLASSQPIKDYAQMLVADHTKDFDQLEDIAHQANLNRPNAIDAEHNKMMIDPFQNLKGTAFDHRYIQEMITGHTKAIAVI
jgi:putative membrane protein